MSFFVMSKDFCDVIKTPNAQYLCISICASDICVFMEEFYFSDIVIDISSYIYIDVVCDVFTAMYHIQYQIQYHIQYQLIFFSIFCEFIEFAQTVGACCLSLFETCKDGNFPAIV